MADKGDIPGGVVHDLPEDLKEALQLHPEALATWEDITPLARNEWICWVQSPEETRDEAQTCRVGVLKLEGRETPSLLLARMPTSRGGANGDRLVSAFHPKLP